MELTSSFPRACKESCVRNRVWVYPVDLFPYGDSRMDAALKLHNPADTINSTGPRSVRKDSQKRLSPIPFRPETSDREQHSRVSPAPICVMSLVGVKILARMRDDEFIVVKTSWPKRTGIAAGTSDKIVENPILQDRKLNSQGDLAAHRYRWGHQLRELPCRSCRWSGRQPTRATVLVDGYCFWYRPLS